MNTKSLPHILWEAFHQGGYGEQLKQQQQKPLDSTKSGSHSLSST